MLKKTWILLDGITKIQSQPLETDELQMAILKLSERDWVRFYIWTPGWENWQMLKDFLQSGQTEFALPKAQVSEENIKVQIKKNINDKQMTRIKMTEDTVVPVIQKDFCGDLLDENALSKPPEPIDFKEIRDSYKNRAQRHELKIEILLANQKGKSFKSYSKNISVTGSLLEDNIPFDFYETTFDAVIVNRSSLNTKNSRIQLKAETVGEGLTQRIRFVNCTATQKEKLIQLLNEYVSQQDKIKNQAG